MEKQIYLTQNGFYKFQTELEYLKSKKRIEIAKALKEITILNDDDVDTEYLEIKNQQAFIEGRIRQLEVTLANTILLEKKTANNIVDIGCTVIIKQDDLEKETFTIVSTLEANPRENLISDESPFGKALIGKNKGEIVVVATPMGTVNLRIISVN